MHLGEIFVSSGYLFNIDRAKLRMIGMEITITGPLLGSSGQRARLML